MRSLTRNALALALGLVFLGPVAVSAQDKDADKAKDKDDAKKTAKGDEIAWAKTFAAAREEAKADHKVIMVDVYTDWCGWCKKLDADTYPAPEVVSLARQMSSVKLDAEDKGEGQKFAQTYGVHGFPTILFLDPAEIDDKGGGIVGKIGGYMPPAGFAAEVRTILASSAEFPKLKERLASSPDDLGTLAKLAVAYHQRGDKKKAAELLEKAEKADPKNADGLLTRAYNAVADDYQEAREFDKAIPLFRKAAETGKKPDEIAYAQTSMGVCYLSEGKATEAIPPLEAATKLTGLSDGDRAQAEQLLKAARQMAEKAKSKEKDKGSDDK